MSFSRVNEFGRSRSLSLPTQNLSSYSQKRGRNNPNSVRVFAEGEDSEATSLLRADEIENCRQVYFRYYDPKYGRISLWQLRKALKDLEIQPAEEELFKIIQTIEESENMLYHQQQQYHGLISPTSSSYNNGGTTSRLSKSLVTGESHFQKFLNKGSTVERTGTIDFEQFLAIVVNQRKQDRPIHDNDTLSAFVAMGGNSDRTGAIQTEKLTAACEEFGLTIDIDSLIKEVDDDGNGTVDFDEFTMMMRSNKSDGDDEDNEIE
jgi:Ca2+-binding EF-hand superfamily protein